MLVSNIIAKKRSQATVNAFLILRKGNEVLLHKRKNSGYCDGMWCLVAGHVEDGEPATTAMIREAHEETGIRLKEESLKVVHVMHRLTNRFNVDIFFECSDWEGVVQNMEPEKCEDLKFFDWNHLPSTLMDNIAAALNLRDRGEFYSEMGWD